MAQPPKGRISKHPVTGKFESARDRARRSPSFGKWEPAYPEIAVVAGSREPKRISVRENSKNEDWHVPPDSSHLERFTIFDYPKRTKAEIEAAKKPAKNPMTGKFYKRTSDPLAPTARVIAVIFKAKGKQPRTEYWYYFSDFSQADETYGLMVEAESPGELIHSVMIAQGISYRKVK